MTARVVIVSAAGHCVGRATGTVIRALIIGVALAAPLAAPALDVERYLEATREIEAWDGRDGAHGERGPYQITAAVWAMHGGGKPFAAARQERAGRECARRHVAWLQRELARAGVHPGVFNVALAYNAGLARVLSGRAPERAYDYAGRIRNLYTETVPAPKRNRSGSNP